MSRLWLYTDPCERLHQQALELERQARFARFISPRDYRKLARRGVDVVIALAHELGYRVNVTVNNSPFDLWIEGCRVEVKASEWYENGRSGRYQAALRNHQCDLLVFDCVNGTDHLHFIPQAALGQRRNIAVWSYDPAQSGGLWRPYLEEPMYLHQAIQAARQAWQPPLF